MVDGIEEVSLDELLSDQNAVKMGIIFVHPSSMGSTRCAIAALSANRMGEITMLKEYTDYSDVSTEGGD